VLKPYFCNNDRWQEFKEELLSWVGTPYAHMQRAKGYGADCTMFVGQCYVNIGILSKLTYGYYSRDWHEHTDNPIVEDSIRKNFNENLINKSLSFKKVLYTENDFVRGDFILIATVKQSLSNHCSIMLDEGNKMIHSINHAGVEVTHYVKWWKRHTRYKIRLFEEA